METQDTKQTAVQDTSKTVRKSVMVESSRLILRMLAETDKEAVFRMRTDMELAERVGFKLFHSVDEAEGYIHESIRSGLAFAVAEKEKPADAVGIVELTPSITDNFTCRLKEYELCYYLEEGFRGKGYMTETVQALMSQLFESGDADKLVISVFPWNEASRHVALKCGFRFDKVYENYGETGLGKWEDLEFYCLEKADYMNRRQTENGQENAVSGAKTKIELKENQNNMDKQKWINDGGVFYPIPGYASIYQSPGQGVFQIYHDQKMERLGLTKTDDTFVFDFKLYDLGCEELFKKVITTWFSEIFSKANKNLGVIFNGIKGTGKTIAAKVLSNRIGLPVIVVSSVEDGLLQFIQSLNFECVILIDEAEKTFKDDGEVLLKMIDGVYNSSRKLYLLTTNKLSLDENLIGRPGRIRYIKEFGNLTPGAVNNFIDDNLVDKSKKESIMELVDSLAISTIDILRAIVDEVNIIGEVPDGRMLNIPRADYHFDVIRFSDMGQGRLSELKEFLVGQAVGTSINEWLRKVHRGDGDEKDDNTNLDWVSDRYGCYSDRETIPSAYPYLSENQHVSRGQITSLPDRNGFFTVRNDWDSKDELYLLVGSHGTPSLYHGRLAC